MTIRGLIFPAALCASVLLHTWVLRTGKWSAPVAAVGDPAEVITEVVLIEELPPPPEPEPPEEIPEPPPEPPPEMPPEPPPVEEVLTAPESVAPPAPTPPPKPAPTATPKPKKKPELPEPPKKPSAPRLADAPKPVVISNSPPGYPEFARRKGWEGRVYVRVSVDSAGKPVAVTIAQSSGYAVLDQAALQAVKKWRFRPRVTGGTAVAGTVDVPVNFSLRR